MEEWKVIQLKEVCELIPGFAFKSSEFGEHEYSAIKIGDIQPPYVHEEGLTGVDISRYSKEKLEKFKVYYGDFVLAMTGATIGKIGRYIGTSGAYINQRVLLFRPKENVNKEYLYYCLQTPVFQQYIFNHIDSQTAQPNISAGSVSGFEILLPGISIQNKIADILSALDSKIELNNRINHNLEEQADGIVSSLLNVGTTVLRLSDICKYVSQKIDCQSLTLDNYISTENMVPSRGGVTKSSNVPTGTAIEYSSGDILVSNIRPYFQKIWKATYSGGCSNDVLCFRSSTNSPSFLYHLLRQNSFFDHVMAGAKGSKMPRGDKAQIMNWTFVLSEDWEAMESKLSIIDKKVALLRAQNLMLIELRDSVLPRLMSGELKINDLTC